MNRIARRIAQKPARSQTQTASFCNAASGNVSALLFRAARAAFCLGMAGFTTSAVGATPFVPSSTRSAEEAPSNDLALPPVDLFPSVATPAPDVSLAQLEDELISNASPSQLMAVRLQLAKTARLLAARDAVILQIFGFPSSDAAFSSRITSPRATATMKPLSSAKPRKLPVAAVAAPDSAPLQITLSRLAISSTGALMRITLEAAPRTASLVAVGAKSGKPIATSEAAPQPFVNRTLFTGVRVFDVWFSPQGNGNFSLQAWPVARDAADVMSEEAERLWQRGAQPDDASGTIVSGGDATGGVLPGSVATDANTLGTKRIVAPFNVALPTPSDETTTVYAAQGEPAEPQIAAQGEGDILDLVAEYRGGVWLPLRASAPWRGALLDATSLARAAQRQTLAAFQESASNASNAPLSSTRTVVTTQTSPKISANALPARAISQTPNGKNPATKTPLKSSLRAVAAGAAASAGSERTSASRAVRPWLMAQMNRYRKRAAGTAHFLFQRGANGWVGVDSVFEPAREASDAAYSNDENAVRRFRLQMQSDGWLSPTSHRDFALLLARVHLQSEAADELAKARLMQADLVADGQTRVFESNRVLDPQSEARTQYDALQRVGFAAEHPRLRIPYFLSQMRQTASPLIALRLGLEYSRLGYEREAAKSLAYGEANAAQFLAMPKTNDIDRAWFDVLVRQLKARLAQSATKPSNLVRSDLFTVRCALNDPNAPQLLAGLEAAQFKIYAGFGVPMANTEVVLWSSQSQFQAYTSRESERNTSEFVTALTITKLVNADVGPVVLSEEINFFADPRADSISTIAHEYGHIAVRALAKGRQVSDWLNEGVATYTEGGYDNYLRRVRNAKSARKLLSMRDLQAWNVDGERAFLAYSQANSMVDFLVARWGKNALLDVLTQIGKDIAPDVALRQTVGVSPEGFYALWLQNGIK